MKFYFDVQTCWNVDLRHVQANATGEYPLQYNQKSQEKDYYSNREESVEIFQISTERDFKKMLQW